MLTFVHPLWTNMKKQWKWGFKRYTYILFFSQFHHFIPKTTSDHSGRLLKVVCLTGSYYSLGLIEDMLQKRSSQHPVCFMKYSVPLRHPSTELMSRGMGKGRELEGIKSGHDIFHYSYWELYEDLDVYSSMNVNAVKVWSCVLIFQHLWL